LFPLFAKTLWSISLSSFQFGNPSTRPFALGQDVSRFLTAMPLCSTLPPLIIGVPHVRFSPSVLDMREFNNYSFFRCHLLLLALPTFHPGFLSRPLPPRIIPDFGRPLLPPPPPRRCYPWPTPLWTILPPLRQGVRHGFPVFTPPLLAPCCEPASFVGWPVKLALQLSGTPEL